MATLKMLSAGMVFLMPDKIQRTEGTTSMHNCLILNSPDENNTKVAVMSITSMTNNGYKGTVPILMSTGCVSYIVPTHIFEYNEKMFKMSNFHGMVQEDIMHVDAFISMLIQLYTGHMFGTKYINSDIKNIYKTYCEKFWKIHADAPQYREQKTGKLYFSTPDPEEVEEVVRTSVIGTPLKDVLNNTIPSSTSNDEELSEPIISTGFVADDDDDEHELIYSSEKGVVKPIDSFDQSSDLNQEFDGLLGSKFREIFDESESVAPIKIKKKSRSSKMSKNAKRRLAKRGKIEQKKKAQIYEKQEEKEVDKLFGFIEPYPVICTKGKHSSTYTDQELMYVLETYKTHDMEFMLNNVLYGWNRSTAYSRLISIKKAAVERGLIKDENYPPFKKK